MREAIRQRARELGFDACRFTTAAAPASATQFQGWLAAAYHGQMAYLERNAAKRVDPQKVLAGAKTIVTLAVSYAAERDESATAHAAPSMLPVRLKPPGTARSAAVPAASSGGVSPPGQTPGGTPDELAGETPAPRDLRGSLNRTPSLTPLRSPLHGEVARYARYRDYHDVLGARLKELAAFIGQLGGAGARSLWYVDTGPLLERDLAQRAGVGFIGKHTNLISRQLGNWCFLAEILTTLELAPDEPERNRCGTCVRCLEACPTGAIRAPFQLDARRCISYLTIELKGAIPVELRPAIGQRIYGCDDCLAVCPWNRFAKAGALMRAHAQPELAAPDLLELLALDEAGFRRRFAGTPLLRAKRRGLLRNVCVALGNLGDARALPALRRAAVDPEPLIAEHARWAIERVLSQG